MIERSPDRVTPLRVGAAALAILALGCGIDERVADPGAGPGFDEAAVAELEAAGVGKYLGRFTPDKEETTAKGEQVYTFTASEDGPICLRGGDYRVSVRDVGSRDLMIYLQGGGACWSELCAANEAAGAPVMPIAWTDPSLERNPLASFNVVYVAYCDGSVHSGDNVIRSADGSVERWHRGLMNLSAALDIARARFPEPERILLAGSSAGGYGTILGTAVVRLSYAKTPLFVVNDAGIGLTNPENPSVVNAAVNEWKIGPLIPASCKGCLESGQFTSVVRWGLDHDPTLRVSAYSSYQDGIVAGVFLAMHGQAFEDLLRRETGALHEAHPDRYQRFFINGTSHTAVLGGYTALSIDGTSLTDWTTAMLDGDPAWRDLLEQPGE